MNWHIAVPFRLCYNESGVEKDTGGEIVFAIASKAKEEGI
jgi:hypothetical protein